MLRAASAITCATRNELLCEQCGVCRAIRHNLSDEEYDQYTAAYDQYRRKLTANRIALYPTTMPEIVMDWSRGAVQKYAMHHDTAVVHMVHSGKYYLHGSFAGVGKGYDPVKLDMCASALRHPAYLCLCVASAAHLCGAVATACALVSSVPPWLRVQGGLCVTVWSQMPDMSSSSCRCNNTLAFPAEITLDDVQHLLYGKDLGLSLPFRDPWSHMPLEQIRQYDIPALDRVFTGGGVVSVVERLAAMGGWHAEPAAAERGEARVGTRLLRNRRGGGDQARSSDEEDLPGEHQGASSLRSGEHDTDDDGSDSEVDKPDPRVPLRGGASLLPLNPSKKHAQTRHRVFAIVGVAHHEQAWIGTHECGFCLQVHRRRPKLRRPAYRSQQLRAVLRGQVASGTEASRQSPTVDTGPSWCASARTSATPDAASCVARFNAATLTAASTPSSGWATPRWASLHARQLTRKRNRRPLATAPAMRPAARVRSSGKPRWPCLRLRPGRAGWQ